MVAFFGEICGCAIYLYLTCATDTFEALSDGSLAIRLAAAGIDIDDPGEDFNPYSMLPGWLHAR